MKTPLLVANDSRDESREKDSWGTNILLESEAPTSAVKRPGLTLAYDGTTTGQGVFIWPAYGGYGVSSGSSGSGGSSGSSGSGWSGGFGGFGGSTVVTIEDDELIFPVIVAIGDLVDGYYAMVDNPPTSPGSGDDYWSETPPTSDRWRGTLTVSLSDAPHATSPATVIGAQAGSKAAAAKWFAEVTIAAIYPGLKTLYYSHPLWAVNSKIFGSGYTYVEEFGEGRIKQDTQTHDDAISYPADWPAGSGVWTGMFSEPNDVIGIVCKKKTKTSFTITSTAAVARISTADIPLYPDSTTGLITVSGCDQPEYNGTFYAYREITDPADGYIYYTMSGTPAASPATGSKSIDYWVEL